MKKVIGIISIILFFIISFQSCAAGIGNSIAQTGEVSGSAGFILSIVILIAGILTLVSKDNKGIVITSIIFYIIGGIIAIANLGSYSDLKIWSIISFIFAALLIYNVFKNKELYNKAE